MKSASLLSMLHRSWIATGTWVLAAGLLVAAVILPWTAPAQTLYGTLSGTVTDKTGAVVPNVTVTVTSQGTGAVRSATTGPQGDYQFSDLLPGSYTVSFQAAGFAGTSRRTLPWPSTARRASMLRCSRREQRRQ